MQRKFQCFPELLLVDATYKLNDMRMPVFIQLIVDGNGESEVVSVFVVVSEDAETMSSLLEIFKKHNPAWVQTKTVLSDKDFMERAVYSKHFPNAHLQLCLFHVLRAIRREIHVEKMNIRLEQKNLCLELIQKIAYSNSEELYARNVEQLRETGIQPVVDYYLHSWHPIKEQWVIGLKQSCHYGNNTNNRLESINQKLKQVITRFSNLRQFFEDLELVLRCFRQERDSRLANVLLKRPSLPFAPQSPQARFAKLLTPHAFQIVRKQLELSEKIHISEQLDEVTLPTSSGPAKVTVISCTCQFSTMNQLPCRHVFALRSQLQLDMYFEEGVAQRWRLDFYRSTIRPEVHDVEDMDPDFQTVHFNVQPKPAVLSASQKYRSAICEAQKLATLASEVSMPRYRHRLRVLRDLVQLWEKDEDAAVVSIEEDVRGIC